MNTCPKTIIHEPDSTIIVSSKLRGIKQIAMLNYCMHSIMNSQVLSYSIIFTAGCTFTTSHCLKIVLLVSLHGASYIHISAFFSASMLHYSTASLSILVTD